MELEFTLIYVFGILVIGYILSKIISRIIIKLVRTGRYVEPVERKETIQTIAEKVILVITFSIAILFFGVNSKDGMFLSFFDLVPTVVMIVLMFIMGSVIINLFMWFVKRFLEYIRTEEYFSRESRQFVLPVMIFVIQLILYLSLAHIIFSLVEIPVLQTILGFILYPVIILLFFLLAAGLINPMRDFFARVYLLNIMEFRPGTLIKIDEKEYVIKNVRGMYTELHEKTNGLVIMPNRVIASSTIGIVKPVKEMDTLQKLKDNYVAQSKSHCGPASASMALGIFGYHYTQEELGKLMGTIKRKKATGAAGTHPKSLIETVTRITEGQVVGAWISFDKISSLMKEINIWMRQGGLCIVDYKKKYLFPDAKYAHYSLVAGVRGDELLIVDPSQQSGGVYFSDYRDILIGMDTHSELIQGKRGYIVLAPYGSEAFDRIHKGVIYLDENMYDKVTKQMGLYIARMSNLSAITDTMPSFLRKYLTGFNKEEQVSRVWRPKK